MFNNSALNSADNSLRMMLLDNPRKFNEYSTIALVRTFGPCRSAATLPLHSGFTSGYELHEVRATVTLLSTSYEMQTSLFQQSSGNTLSSSIISLLTPVNFSTSMMSIFAGSAAFNRLFWLL